VTESRKVICDFFNDTATTETYLYVNRDDGLSKVPEDLLAKFGDVEKALSFTLTADRRLAKEDPSKVMSSLDDPGYHLQLPPHKKGMLGAPDQ
jgi:uncharacterized protein YcgL (UPF0745 family)